MNRSLRLLALMLFLVLLVPPASADEKRLTLMVYMAGDNLETNYGFASEDIFEMAASGFDAGEVSLVVLAGGARYWNMGLNADAASTLEFARRGGEIRWRVKNERPDADMGEAETLESFLRDSFGDYPAQEYALVIWGHGGGPLVGACRDERRGGNFLTLEELVSALAASPFAEKPLSWIGFDASLMASVEVAAKLSPFAEYMIASQADEPVGGWNYSFLKGIEKDGNGKETGRRIVDAMLDAPQSSVQRTALSCVDLSKIGDIEKSMDEMFREAGAEPDADTASAIGNLTARDGRFGAHPDSLADLVSLSEILAAGNGAAARKIREAVEAAVTYSRSGALEYSGLSVYHPFGNEAQFLSAWNETYRNLGFCPGYTDYLDSYCRLVTGEP